jgi:demethylmenaquinone methyltransferase/2-methoxy-6-polyprenyl-1,4-benzoquinol methylase
MTELASTPAPSSGAASSNGLMRRAYRVDAALYDARTARYQADRRALVDSLPVAPGQTVVDVGCGTGLCFERLQAKVGSRGGVIGVDESPDMLALAALRVAHAGWRNVTLVHASAQHAILPVVADAALFCAVHDVLQSRPALANIVAQLRPRGWVAAAGGRFAPRWMVGPNLLVRAAHSPYVRSFDGFDRPWRHLAELVPDLRITTVALGVGYHAVGRRSADHRRNDPA